MESNIDWEYLNSANAARRYDTNQLFQLMNLLEQRKAGVTLYDDHRPEFGEWVKRMNKEITRLLGITDKPL